MTEQERQKLIDEYSERHVRWSDKNSSQLSFYNNLLLTLGVGFLSFAYQDSKLMGFEFSLKEIDYSVTTYVFSILAIMFSIFTGFVASIGRLYDFRITSHIILVRQRVLQHSHLRIDEKTPQKFSYFRRMLLPYKLFFSDFPSITLEQCKAWRRDKNHLTEQLSKIRAISFNLGLATWHRIKWQTLLLLTAIIFYVISILWS
jgi:hypothetical protein